MGFVFALSSLSLFLSYRYMDAGIASTLLFVYPIMVAVIMAVAYKEKISALTVGAIAVATAGIGLLYNGGEQPLSAFGTLLVFVSSLTYAIYIVYVNHSRLEKVPTLAVTFYVLLFGWTTLALKTGLSGSLTLPADPALWGNIAALAIFPTAISLLCTTAAIQDIGSTPTAILGALEPVTAVVIGSKRIRRDSYAAPLHRTCDDSRRGELRRGRFEGKRRPCAPAKDVPQSAPKLTKRKIKKNLEKNFAERERMPNFAPQNECTSAKARKINRKQINKTIKMIIVQVKEGENIERALKKFKRKYERTGIVKELRRRQAFEKPSVTNRKKMIKAIYVQQLRQAEQ